MSMGDGWKGGRALKINVYVSLGTGTNHLLQYIFTTLNDFRKTLPYVLRKSCTTSLKMSNKYLIFLAVD